MTRHQSGLVPVVEDVPLRIQGAANAYRSTGLAVVGEADPGRQGPRVRAHLLHPPDGAEPHLGAGSAVPGGT